MSKATVKNRISSPSLKKGALAPKFNAIDQNGKPTALSLFLGKRVILYFYPKDMTPGCTTEACDFKNSILEFKKLKVHVIGVSRDSAERHRKFIEKYQLPFLLLSDETGEICKSYRVWKEKSLYGKTFMGIERSTFVIGKNGKIEKVFSKVKVKEHVQELLTFLKE